MNITWSRLQLWQIPPSSLLFRRYKFPGAEFAAGNLVPTRIVHPTLFFCQEVQTNTYENVNGIYVPINDVKQANKIELLVTYTDITLFQTSVAVHELKWFPSLQSAVSAVANEALDNTGVERPAGNYPGGRVERAGNPTGNNHPVDNPQEKAAPALSDDRYSEGHFRRIASNVSAIVRMVSDSLKNTIPKAVVYCQGKEAKQSLLNNFYVQMGKKEGEQLAEFLDEDPTLMAKRQQYAKRLELYKKAREEIESVSRTQSN